MPWLSHTPCCLSQPSFVPVLPLWLLFALGFALSPSLAADKLRLYDFEEGSPGAVTTTVADKITDPILFADGTGIIEVSGTGVPRPLPAGNLMDVVDANANAAPALNGFFGSTATFVDVSSAPPTASFGAFTVPSASTRALQFSGSGVFDDFDEGKGSKVVFFDQDSYNNNDPMVPGSNTFESFNLLFQAWVKPNSSAQGAEQIVMEATRTWGQFKITSDNLWEIGGFGGGNSISTTEAVVFDDWTHLALLRTGGGATFYVNGAVAGTIGGFFSVWPDTINLGGGSFGFMPYTGLIDDYSISGTPLTGFDVVDDLDFFEGINIDLSTADINLDGMVDQLDYDIFAANVGFDNGSGVGDPYTYIDGDVDQNGKIDFFDFHQISLEAAAAGNPLVLNGANVPEPASLALVAMGCVALALGRRRTVLFAVLLLAVVVPSGKASAEVVVAEDFFYKQPTKSVTSLGGFVGASYGGGQNGPGGTWDDRWVSIGGSTIVGEDVDPGSGLAAGIHSGVVTRFSTDISLQRDFQYSPSTLTSEVIYFAASMKVVNASQVRIFGEFGFAAPVGDVDAPVASLGITDMDGGITPTFFAQLGGTTVTGDVSSDSDDALVNDTFQRIVGKLEINAASPNGDFDTDGDVDGSDFLLWQRNPSIGDLADWQANFGSAGAERLTVYFDPTGVESSNATVLTVEAEVMTGLADTSLASIVSLNGADASDDGRPLFIDDVVIGTTWEDVVTVSVPRLTLEVDTTSGDVTIVNDTNIDVDLAYYEILSDAGSLLDSWNSLDDQNLESGEWAENNPSANQLVESNFTDSTTILSAGGSLTLAGAYNTVIDAQDLVARWGVKGGSDGLLNLANVVYDPPAAIATSVVPEPSTCTVTISALCLLIGSRQRSRREK